MIGKWQNDRKVAYLVLIFFGMIYASIIIPNHLLFRTYALDLGLYTHVAWHYLHGEIHDSSLFLETAQPILADHFDLYLPLFSPFLLLFGTWTFLLVQTVSVLLGAWGMLRLLLELKVPPMASLGGMLMFLGSFAVMAAVSSTIIRAW